MMSMAPPCPLQNIDATDADMTARIIGTPSRYQIDGMFSAQLFVIFLIRGECPSRPMPAPTSIGGDLVVNNPPVTKMLTVTYEEKADDILPSVYVPSDNLRVVGKWNMPEDGYSVALYTDGFDSVFMTNDGDFVFRGESAATVSVVNYLFGLPYIGFFVDRGDGARPAIYYDKKVRIFAPIVLKSGPARLADCIKTTGYKSDKTSIYIVAGNELCRCGAAVCANHWSGQRFLMSVALKSFPI
jgi:hypothetical protein